ncbi:MAG: SUMF1/EgtB/PvdO family nonheme iron enzyme [Fibrobacter sp.]|nr:SUMF1/EgtB/PvdO family nonheme iron enzyme [Fibrobacter sp.]
MKFLLLLLILLGSCADKPTSPKNKDPLEPDMLTIKDKGKIVPLGYPDHDRLWVHLDYDFEIGVYELSRKDYFALMEPQLEVEDPNLPITEVSWYEALLYCNALSRRLHLDTVYAYQSLKLDENNQVLGIDGLVVNWQVDGYRLPTEAEWIVATKMELGTEQAWYNANSNSQLQPVGTKAKKHGLYDMAGNAMEWTQDWWMPLHGDTINNYAGGLSASEEGGVVVKGGSYTHDESFLSVWRRTDTYSTTPENRRPYLGFRVVKGAVNAVAYTNNDGKITNSYSHILASKETLFGFTGMSQAKLSFVNQEQQLILVDWTAMPTERSALATSAPPHSPSISPNGRWLVYSTRGEGQNSSGQSIIIDLRNGQEVHSWEGVLARWWVQAADTFLVYASSPINNENEAWNSTYTASRSFKQGQLGDENIITAEGAFHGGISADGQLLVSGANKLVAARKPDFVRQEWFPYQVCNVSLSPGDESQVAFLDFGSSEDKIVGRAYGIHEYLFVADSTGKIVFNFAAAKPYLGFTNPEWTNVHPFLVSNLFDKTDYSPLISLYNMVDSTSLKLVQTEHSRDPYMWIGGYPWSKITLSDSAANYNYPPLSGEQEIFGAKIRQLWLMDRTEVKLAAVGDSRIMYGFDPLALNFSGYNFAISNTGPWVHFRIAKEYLLRHLPNLRYLLFGISLSNFGVPDITWDERIAHDQGWQYDANHHYWDGGLSEEFIQAAKVRINEKPYQHLWKNKGASSHVTNSWSYGKPPWPEPWPLPLDFQPHLDSLQHLLQMATEHGVQVIGVIMPQSPRYLDSDFYGPEGLSDSAATILISALRQMEVDNSNFHFWDENNYGDHSYLDKHAYDDFHLSGAGAKYFSERLQSYLADLD